MHLCDQTIRTDFKLETVWPLPLQFQILLRNDHNLVYKLFDTVSNTIARQLT